MFKDYDWILFDLDNTLLDFSACSKLAFKDLMSHFEIEGSHQELYESYSPINAKYWHYFEKQKVDAATLRTGRFEEFLKVQNASRNASELADKYLEYLIKHSFWIAGAEDLLKELSTKKQLGIITNGLQDAQHARLEKHDMKQYFQHIFISEEIGYSKPHQNFFQTVHDQIGLPTKEKVLVVGDNPKSDIKGVRNFNYHSCWFNYKKEKGKGVKANFSIKEW